MGKHHPDGGKPPIGRSGPLLEINAKKDIPWDVFFALEASPGIGPGNKGFADLCLTAWLWRRINAILCLNKMERITGLEPATSTLARSRSTK